MPERVFHFISGLPRAGSTLTAAILRQNPRFHAGMSSPVASLFDHLIAQVEYDLLTTRPGDVFKLVYEFLAKRPSRTTLPRSNTTPRNSTRNSAWTGCTGFARR
jgi:hypothetical protein